MTIEDIKKLNIYEKMYHIEKEITGVEKKIEIGKGNFGYKAVADADVLGVVKEFEGKYRIKSHITDLKVLDSQIKALINSKGQEVTTYIDTVLMTVEFVNIDNPDEKVKVMTAGKGIDNGDKGLGKATTYARKYALLNAYKIVTGDDIDKQKSEPMKMLIGDKLALILNNTDLDRQQSIIKHFSINDIVDLNEEQADTVLDRLRKEGKLNV